MFCPVGKRKESPGLKTRAVADLFHGLVESPKTPRETASDHCFCLLVVTDPAKHTLSGEGPVA